MALADLATSEMYNIEMEQKKIGSLTTKASKKTKRMELIHAKNATLNKFAEAAENFVKLGLKQQAAQCFFSAQNY